MNTGLAALSTVVDAAQQLRELARLNADPTDYFYAIRTHQSADSTNNYLQAEVREGFVDEYFAVKLGCLTRTANVRWEQPA